MPTMLAMKSPRLMMAMVAVAKMQVRMQGPAVVAVHGRRVVAVHGRYVVIVLDVHSARRGLVVMVMLDYSPINNWRVLLNHRRTTLAIH
jgi:hypothetical protein